MKYKLLINKYLIYFTKFLLPYIITVLSLQERNDTLVFIYCKAKYKDPYIDKKVSAWYRYIFIRKFYSADTT